MASYKLSSPFPAGYDHVRHTVFMVGTATRATDSYAEFVIVVTICCCSHEWVVFVSTSRAVVIVITVIYAIIGRTLVPVAPAAVIVGASGAGSPRSAMRMRRHFPGGIIKNPSTGELASHSHSVSCSTVNSHTHGYWNNAGGDGHQSYNGDAAWDGKYQTDPAGSHTHTITIANTGNNTAHENRMPYVVINRWKRTV